MKRSFKKILPLKKGNYSLGRFYTVYVYERSDGSIWVSHWWNSYRKLIDKLVREHLEGVGQAD